MKLRNLVVAAALMLGGCVHQRWGNEYVHWSSNLPSEERTVSVHPADGGAGRGGVTVDDSFSCPFRPKFGLEVATEGDVRVSAGIDATYNFGIENQELQPLPEPYESYGYACFRPWLVMPEPFVSLSADVARDWSLNAEVGMPYSEFRLERGHYRWDDNEALEEIDLGGGFGWSASLGVEYRRENGFLKLHVATEHFEAELDGEPLPLYNWALGVDYRFRW